jgi:hypothetical protein
MYTTNLDQELWGGYICRSSGIALYAELSSLLVSVYMFGLCQDADVILQTLNGLYNSTTLSNCASLLIT